jgi:hypothetical protein
MIQIQKSRNEVFLIMKNKVSSGQGAGPAIMAKNARILINKTSFIRTISTKKEEQSL